MCKRVLDEEIKKVNDALLDPDKYHLSIEHGAEVQQAILKKFGVNSLEEAIEYMKKACEFNFDHVNDASLYLEILMIAEKGSLALEIAKCLSNGRFQARTKDGHLGYAFRCTMFGRDANVWVIWTSGHFQEHDFADYVGNEDKENILRAKVERQPCKSKDKFPAFLKQMARGCHAAIFCLDNDSEGEAICFDVLDHIKQHIVVPPNGNVMDYVYRARFSSTTEIVHAVKNLVRLNVFSYFAVEMKHHYDLKVSSALNKIHRIYSKDIANTDLRKISYGSCLLPCLKLVVDHYLLAKNAPTAFWLEFSIPVNGKELVFHYLPLDEDEAEKRYATLPDVKCCRVVGDPKRGELFTVKPPPGLNTFEALESLSKLLDLSPAAVAGILQKLYECGGITYPRSESTKFPENMKIDVKQLFEILCKLMTADEIAFSPSMCLDVNRVLGRGVDKGDHPPVMPTGKVFTDNDVKRLKQQTGESYDKYVAAYDFICRHLLASFMFDYRYFKETITFDIGGHKFDYTYFQNEFNGFTQVLPEFQVETPSNDILEKLVPGAQFPVTVSVKQCPSPSFLRDYELVRQMEKYKIGTDGSIPNHIANIQKKGYVKSNNGLEPTPLGLLMIQCFDYCIPEMAKPETRAKFIKAVEEIATGERDFVTFYNETLREIYATSLEYEKMFPDFIEYNKREAAIIKLSTFRKKLMMARDAAAKQSG